MIPLRQKHPSLILPRYFHSALKTSPMASLSIVHCITLRPRFEAKVGLTRRYLPLGEGTINVAKQIMAWWTFICSYHSAHLPQILTEFMLKRKAKIFNARKRQKSFILMREQRAG